MRRGGGVVSRNRASCGSGGVEFAGMRRGGGVVSRNRAGSLKLPGVRIGVAVVSHNRAFGLINSIMVMPCRREFARVSVGRRVVNRNRAFGLKLPGMRRGGGVMSRNRAEFFIAVIMMMSNRRIAVIKVPLPRLRRYGNPG